MIAGLNNQSVGTYLVMIQIELGLKNKKRTLKDIWFQKKKCHGFFGPAHLSSMAVFCQNLSNCFENSKIWYALNYSMLRSFPRFAR